MHSYRQELVITRSKFIIKTCIDTYMEGEKFSLQSNGIFFFAVLSLFHFLFTMFIWYTFENNKNLFK